MLLQLDGLVSRSEDPVAVAADAVEDLVWGLSSLEGLGLLVQVLIYSSSAVFSSLSEQNTPRSRQRRSS